MADLDRLTSREPSLPQFDWNDIEEPGCYLHLPSGLLARVSSEELAPLPPRTSSGGRVIRLSANPGAPLAELREIARTHALPISF